MTFVPGSETVPRVRNAVVVLDGPLGDDPAVVGALSGADLVVAADGGAARLARFGRAPDLVVGDFDSLDPDLAERLAAGGAQMQRHPRDKDLTDGELALLAALERAPAKIVVLGMLGGPRADMALANQMLLFHPRLPAGSVMGLAPGWSVYPVGEMALELAARSAAILSLVPIDSVAEGVDLDGVKWPLRRAILDRGSGRTLSNQVAAERVRVRCRRGRLLLFLEH